MSYTPANDLHADIYRNLLSQVPEVADMPEATVTKMVQFLESISNHFMEGGFRDGYQAAVEDIRDAAKRAMEAAAKSPQA